MIYPVRNPYEAPTLQFSVRHAEEKLPCVNCGERWAVIRMDRQDDYCGHCAVEVWPELEEIITTYDDGTAEVRS